MTDHVTEQKLNLEEVGRYFESKGYKVQKLEQPWRHIVGLLKFENEKLFLKLASTSGIGERTINEAEWDKNTNTVWKKYITTFKTPKLFDEGYFQDRYWFIGEYVFGKPIAEVSGKNSNIESKDLIKSAEIAKEILSLANYSLLPKDIEHFREIWNERIYDTAKDWSKKSKHDTKMLLRFIEDNKNNIQISSSHGDFTPWNIIKTKDNQYYLIDSEASQMAGVKFYDAAYFYHRVYTKLKQPDLAEKFMTKFKEIYKWSKEDAFAPVLASRIMGGYFDAERDGVTSVELNEEMERKLVDR